MAITNGPHQIYFTDSELEDVVQSLELMINSLQDDKDIAKTKVFRKMLKTEQLEVVILHNKLINALWAEREK